MKLKIEFVGIELRVFQCSSQIEYILHFLDQLFMSRDHNFSNLLWIFPVRDRRWHLVLHVLKSILVNGVGMLLAAYVVDHSLVGRQFLYC